MEQLRRRALEIITGQQTVERVSKRCRILGCIVSLVCFMVGFVVGTMMPFQIKAVPIQEVKQAPASHIHASE